MKSQESRNFFQSSGQFCKLNTTKLH